jgi:hypothetical protein
LSRPLAWHAAQCCSNAGFPFAARAESTGSGYLGAGRFISQSSSSCIRRRKKGDDLNVRPRPESRITERNEVVAPSRFISMSPEGRTVSLDQSAWRASSSAGQVRPGCTRLLRFQSEGKSVLSTLLSSGSRRKLNLVRFMGASRPGPHRGR